MKKTINYSIYIFLLTFYILYSCGNNMETDKTKNFSKQKRNEESPREDEANALLKSNWRNPFMTPMGADISRVIRGYYLVGDFEKMLQFVIYPECYDRKEIIHLLRKSEWGYELKANNLLWQADSSFVLNVRTTKQQTVGVEQYYGKIVNDTAKLILFPEKIDLFPYFGDELSTSPCALKTNLDNVQFYYNEAKILSKSKSSLDEICSYLANNLKYYACFIGHTSDEGDADYNLTLSKARAKAIYDYLLAKGISKQRLSYEGRGFSEPLYPNTTAANKAKNRRVEIKLTRLP